MGPAMDQIEQLSHLQDLRGSQKPDPERARRAIIRSMTIWTPAFVLLAVGAVYLMIEALSGNSGSWFGFSLAALMGLLSGFSALSAWRDLFSRPVETTGQIGRKWRKFDLLFFFRAHYVLLSRRVFRVSIDVYNEMPEPGGWVYCLHYPHTNALIAWRPLGSDEIPESDLDEDEDEDNDESEDWGAQLERRERAEARSESVDLPEFGGRDRE